MNKRTRKKWTCTEWLLLLAPLVLIAGLSAMNFAPQIGRAWREWRDYGGNRPYSVFYPQTKNEKLLKPYLGAFAFSPNSKQLAFSETLSNGSGFGSPTRVRLWRLGEEKSFCSWLVPEPQNSASGDLQLRYLDDKTIFASASFIKRARLGLGMTFSEEKRDASNGLLLVGKQLKSPRKKDFPAWVETLNYYDTKHYSRQKNGLSVKVWFQEIEMSRPKNTAWSGDQKLRFFADVKNIKERSSYRIPLAEFIDTQENRLHSNKTVQIAFSSDLRFIFLYLELRQVNPDTKKFPPQEYIEVFDTQSKKSLWRLDHHADDINNVAFSHRGIIAISENRQLEGSSYISSTRTELRSVQTGELLRVIQNGGISGHTNSAEMQFSPDGKLLAVPQDDRLELWDVSDLN